MNHVETHDRMHKSGSPFRPEKTLYQSIPTDVYATPEQIIDRLTTGGGQLFVIGPQKLEQHAYFPFHPVHALFSEIESLETLFR